MPRLVVYPQGYHADTMLKLPQRRVATAAAACLAAAVPLAALTAAALRWRPQRADTQAGGFRALRDAEAAADGPPGDRGRPPCAAGAHAARRRRLQDTLATCLRTEGRRLELLPLGALPVALAHDLSAAQHAHPQRGGGGQAADAERSRQPLLAEQPAACHAGAEQPGRHAAAAQSRQWGLPTESLRLDSTCLEVRPLHSDSAWKLPFSQAAGPCRRLGR